MDSDDVINQNHFYKETILKGLSIVEDYVIKNKLILVGGLSIDLSLRTKGDKIYEDDQILDIDIISDKNLFHCQQLARILCEDGFEDINVINAIHMTTCRLRFKNVPLLDSTYMPSTIINKIPYIDDNLSKFRLIHPNYQKIDQYLSLSTLMNDTGISLNIFNRTEKDYNRNKLLVKYFELPKSNPKFDTIPISIDLNLIKLDKTKIKFLDKNGIRENIDPSFMNEDICFQATNDICINGVLAYSFLYREYCTYSKEHNKKINPDIINPNLNIIDNIIHFDLPVGLEISLLNCNNNMDNIIDQLKKYYGEAKIDKYHILLDLKPFSINLPYEMYEIELIDSFSERICANSIAVGEERVIMVNYNYLLAYFLYSYYFYEDTSIEKKDSLNNNDSLNNIYMNYHKSLQLMVSEMHTYKLNNHSIFYPSINLYGIKLYPEYYQLYLENTLFPSDVRLRPQSIYPRKPKCFTDKKFEFEEQSHYYKKDGSLDNSIEHTNINYLLEARLKL
jgi:hypothetical protein